ncbi:MAG: FUSC family protein [Gammaproteobacteria bacterium]|nr:FUSC family protein [Gammaproteobacteria bacterium]MCW5583122.1 FUSC family protein [Gammaproteobacteria bacterium]
MGLLFKHHTKSLVIFYSHYAKNFSFQHALNVGLAVFVACIAQYYVSFSEEYWIVLTAFFVSQTTRGTPVRQGMIFLLIIMAAIFAASILRNYVVFPAWIYLVLAGLFITSGYVTFIHRPLPNQLYFSAILFSVVLLIATLSPVKTVEYTQNRMTDVLIGAFIGLLFTFLVLPVRAAKEFSEGVTPTLYLLNNYISVLCEIFQSNLTEQQDCLDKKVALQQVLQAPKNAYPEWVYEAGFNRRLRSGFRFFLINLERVTEILFSIDYILSREIDKLVLDALSESLVNAMLKNQELLTILLEYFATNQIKDTKSNFTSDISELEKSLHRLVPNHLELLSISDQNILVTALVRDVRDMRELLLQLVMSLPQY